MKWRRQEKTGEDFARRVLEEVSFRERQEENARYERDMVNAFQELTGLTKEELEAIIMKVGDSLVPDRDNFFSVRQQVVLASAMLVVLQCLVWMI